jgi:thiol:disulfide interchange protein
MKKYLTGLLALVLLPLFSFPQILDPVKWTFKTEQTKPDEATLLLIANADRGWHVYSQDVPQGGPNGAPIPTTFTFTASKNFELVGKVQEPKAIEENDPNFDMILKFFADKAIFKQKIKILSRKDFVVKGVVNFMCCDDKQCLPPNDVEFELAVKGNPNAVGAVAETAQPVVLAVSQQDSLKKVALATAKLNSDARKIEQSKLGETDADKAADQSLLWFFLISFLAGLAAIVTPCVFPMIPMTVTFFMHDNTSKRKAKMQAIVYGLSIIVIYMVLGVLVAVTLGANFNNFISPTGSPMFSSF